MELQNLEEIRANNRRVVLQCIREAGAVARVEIAGLVDISPTTVSNVTRELLADGLIETVEQATPRAPPGRGRPKTLLRLRPGAAHAVGIKLALHQAAVSVTNFVGDLVASETVPFAPHDRTPDRVIDLCERQIERMLDLSGLRSEQVLGVGIGVSGCVDFRTGEVEWSPMFADRHVPLKAAVEARTGLNVVIDNEANLAGLAEKWFGFGRAHPCYLLVTVEHGVGMSIVINHQVYRGQRGFAGEFGHTKIELGGARCRCGRRGCVEAYVADYAIVRKARHLIGPVPIRDQQAVEHALDGLVARADGGDEEAAAVFGQAGHVLGVALANAVNLFDPAMIVICGQRAAHSARAFMESLRRSMADHVLVEGVPPVRVHAWGDELWARGAAALVLEQFMPKISLVRRRRGTMRAPAALAAAK